MQIVFLNSRATNHLLFISRVWTRTPYGVPILNAATTRHHRLILPLVISCSLSPFSISTLCLCRDIDVAEASREAQLCNSVPAQHGEGVVVATTNMSSKYKSHVSFPEDSLIRISLAFGRFPRQTRGLGQTVLASSQTQTNWAPSWTTREQTRKPRKPPTDVLLRHSQV